MGLEMPEYFPSSSSSRLAPHELARTTLLDVQVHEDELVVEVDPLDIGGTRALRSEEEPDSLRTKTEPLHHVLLASHVHFLPYPNIPLVLHDERPEEAGEARSFLAPLVLCFAAAVLVAAPVLLEVVCG